MTGHLKSSAVPTLPVKPEYGPTLPALLARLPRAARIAVIALGAVVLLALVAFALTRGGGEERVVVEKPVAYNLKVPDTLNRVDPRPGESLRLEGRRRDGLFLQSFGVRPLRLPAYRGEASAVLPLVAERLVDRERKRLPGFTLVREGRVRINEVPGYELVTSFQRDGRRMWSRVVLLVPDEDGAREGAQLSLLATPATGVPNASAVGDQGALKLPLRSFRFGTEAP